MSTRPTSKRSFGVLLFAPMIFGGCYEGLNGRGNSPALDTDGAPPVGEGSSDDGDDDGGGTGDSPPLVGPEVCVDTKRFFEQDAWGPVFNAKCYSCHNRNGAAKASYMVLEGNDYPGYLDANYNTIANVARLEIEGTSLLLLKPSMEIEHGGGVQAAKGSDDYTLLEELVEKFAAPVHCVDDEDIKKYFAGIVELDEEETLRKATVLMASRLPTQEEYDAVRGEGMAAVETVLDSVMEEEAFYVRVKEIFNDLLQTNAYLVGSTAIDLLDRDRFPDKRWYDLLPEEQIGQNRDWANDSVALEPIKIIEAIVRGDRPFSEVLTADYTVINPYAGRSYGLPMRLWDDPNDPDEYIEYTFDDIPQAGVLSTPAFLGRYPSTDTNRNRHRSRIVYKYFLATDVLALASRPIDITSVVDFNPTLYNPQCNACHDNVDPLAGAFQNWTNEGWYRPSNTGWFPDMRPPGFGDDEIPYEETDNALRWLAGHLVDDPKFSLALTHTVFKGLTGQDPRPEPLDGEDPNYVAMIKAFQAQDYSFQKVAEKFDANGQNIKEIFKGIATSTWFRAVSLEAPAGDERLAELEPMGTARLLPPEALHRKLIATVGFPWRRNGTDLLLDINQYLLFYGGTDSINAESRLTEMNGVMVNIVERMANEVGCYATSNDFVKPREERLLFPEVEMTDTPDTAEQKIRDNIRYLHQHLLGVKNPDEEELDRTYLLFQTIWADGYAGANPPEGESATYSAQLPGLCQAINDRLTGDPIPDEQRIIDDPDYTVRAWMAVVTYLVGDYQFLYE